MVSAPTSAVSTGSATVRHCPSTPAAAAVPSASAGQRVWNRQPAGIRVGSGVSPLSTIGSRRVVSGTTESSAWV